MIESPSSPRMLRAALGIVVASATLCACASVPRGTAVPPRATSSPSAAPSATIAASPAGSWQGVANIPDMDPIPVAVTLDSTASGWSGTLTSDRLGPQPVPFTSVRRTADSVEAHLPAEAQYATMRGRLSADGKFLEGVVDVHDTQGTFRLARAGTPEAAALTRTP